MTERFSRDDLEELLPWRATGRLSQEEADRVDEALARDPSLRRSLDAIGDDMAAVVAANAETAPPGRAARDRLMRMVDAHEATRPRAFAARLMARLRASPRSNVYLGAAAAAAVLIVVQAAALTDLLVVPRTAVYRTASAPTTVAGAVLLVQFAAGAKIADVAALLDRDGMSLVEGPLPGGLWKVRIGAADAPQQQIDAAIATLRAQPNLISMVLPGGH